MIQLRKVQRPRAPYPVWIEQHPNCPHCHGPRKPGHQAIGWLACGCVTNGTGGHRTLYCRDCGFEQFIPPHLEQHGPAQT